MADGAYCMMEDAVQDYVSSYKAIRADANTTTEPVENDAQDDDRRRSRLLETIRSNLPPDPLLSTPFGSKRLLYADYTASGRPLTFVEDFISDVVHPLFANTHTEVSATGLQSTHLREEARTIVLQSLGCDSRKDEIIFCGSGCTAAVSKFATLLGLFAPSTIRRYVRADVDRSEKALILISHMEHHSNELIWRDSPLVDVLRIDADPETGGTSLTALERALETQKHTYARVVGSFSAASNVTGLRNDVEGICRLCHAHGALACFDFAASGPYVDIDMNFGDPMKGEYLDAIFLSPHKCVGGPGTPGVLALKKELVTFDQTTPPTLPAGGTVAYVSPTSVLYERVLHEREEGGTPEILGAIRCGVIFHLRNAVSPRVIESLEGSFASRAVSRLSKHPNVELIGMKQHPNAMRSSHRLSITSFNIVCRPNGKSISGFSETNPAYLHFNFVTKLLNDVYGIQARSGCSCAGSYGSYLFDIESGGEKEKDFVDLTTQGVYGLKLGWNRVNFNYFMSEDEFDYVLTAIEQIATHGWKLLPTYVACYLSGQFIYNGGSFNRFDGIRAINEIKFTSGSPVWKSVSSGAHVDRATHLAQAIELYDDAPRLVRSMLGRVRDTRKKDFTPSRAARDVRWFALGSDVLLELGVTQDEIEKARAVVAEGDSLEPSALEDDTVNPNAMPGLHTFVQSCGT